jgi:hypothetical protein
MPKEVVSESGFRTFEQTEEEKELLAKLLGRKTQVCPLCGRVLVEKRDRYPEENAFPECGCFK